MSDASEWVELKDTLTLFAVWTVNSLLEALFLALWIGVQWLLNKWVVAPLKLFGMDAAVLIVFQFLFSIATLAPVLMTIYRNIRVMLVRTQRRIRAEIRMGDERDSD